MIFEFFLEKLEKSKYRNHFIIKGGFLVSSILKIDYRTTLDLDVTIQSLLMTRDSLSNTIRSIIQIETIEGLKMTLSGIEKFGI